MKYAIALILALILAGCATSQRIEYYPPEPGTIPGEDGQLRGAVKAEETSEAFTLGTQGLGDYQFLPVSIF